MGGHQHPPRSQRPLPQEWLYHQWKKQSLLLLKVWKKLLKTKRNLQSSLKRNKVTLVVLGSNSSIRGGGEDIGGNGGRDELTDSNPEPSDSKGEEEDEEDKDDEEMADPNIEWMTQGSLALPDVLHKMPKLAERMNIKFNLDSAVKAGYHLDNFYLQL